MSGPRQPRLCGIVVHWHDPAGAVNLASSWPQDPRFELLVIDNSGDAELPDGAARLVRPSVNLGFAGAINLGLASTEAPIVLILNPDCAPRPGALEEILSGFERHPQVAGLVPSLRGLDGRSQHRWHLRPLPKAWQLLCQGLMLPVWTGPSIPPQEATVIEQPAAAAIAVRRQKLLEIGGLDEDFYPAWFEDVDLAARLAARGEIFRYWPAASFTHGLGSSLDALGYSSFLWLHYRNLWLYLRKHHGRLWAEATRLLMVPASLSRLGLLPLRKPRRAKTRREAAEALATLALGAASRWHRPRHLRRKLSRPPGAEMRS